MSQIKWLSFSWAYCLILILLSQIHWISAQQQATIINCGNGGVVFDPSNFTVTLDTSANTIRFVGIGHTSVNITNGTAEMTVSAVGKELSTQTKNICDLASCPMAANSYFSFNYTQALPITIPPLVEADVVIAGYDSFNVNLMCLDIRFDFSTSSYQTGISAASWGITGAALIPSLAGAIQGAIGAISGGASGGVSGGSGGTSASTGASTFPGAQTVIGYAQFIVLTSMTSIQIPIPEANFAKSFAWATGTFSFGAFASSSISNIESSLGGGSLRKRSDDGSLSVGFDPNENGIDRFAKLLSIQPGTMFLEILSIFLILILIISFLFFCVIGFAFVIKDIKPQFKDSWKTFFLIYIGALHRILNLVYMPLLTMSFHQLSRATKDAWWIVLVAIIVIVLCCIAIRIYITWTVLKLTPEKGLYEKKAYTFTYGPAYLSYNEHNYWFFVVDFIYQLSFAAFIGLAGGSPATQVVFLVLIELAFLVCVVIRKPMKDAVANKIMITICVFRGLMTGLLIPQLDIVNLSADIKNYCGYGVMLLHVIVFLMFMSLSLRSLIGMMCCKKRDKKENSSQNKMKSSEMPSGKGTKQDGTQNMNITRDVIKSSDLESGQLEGKNNHHGYGTEEPAEITVNDEPSEPVEISVNEARTNTDILQSFAQNQMKEEQDMYEIQVNGGNGDSDVNENNYDAPLQTQTDMVSPIDETVNSPYSAQENSTLLDTNLPNEVPPSEEY